MEHPFKKGDNVILVSNSNEVIKVGENDIVERVASDGAVLIRGFFMSPKNFTHYNPDKTN